MHLESIYSSFPVSQTSVNTNLIRSKTEIKLEKKGYKSEKEQE